MPFTSCWVSSSSSGFLSDVDTLGLVFPANGFVRWFWNTVLTSAATPYVLANFTLPSFVTGDCAVTFDIQYGVIGNGLATDNAIHAYTLMTQRRVAGVITTDSGTSNIMAGNTAGTIASLSTISYVDNAGTWDIKVTPSAANNQKYWCLVKVVVFYE